MIRHLSVFFIKDEGNKEENTVKVLQALDTVGKAISACAYTVARNVAAPPPGAPAGPGFGDIVQVVDFDSMASAIGYATHPAHKRLVEEAGPMIRQVTVIEYEVEG